MRLNLVNQATIVGLALADNKQSINPRFGSVSRVNEQSFKYAPNSEMRRAFLVPRVDLGLLFKGIPQSLVGVSYVPAEPVPAAELAELLGAIGTDPVMVPDLLEPECPDVIDETDILGRWFSLWINLVGLRDLHRHEVDLDIFEGYLIINADKATLYKGAVSVKVEEDVV